MGLKGNFGPPLGDPELPLSPRLVGAQRTAGPRGGRGPAGPGRAGSAEDAGTGGADQDRGPGAEGAPGLGQGAELRLGGGLGQLVEVGDQVQGAGLADGEDVGEAGAADDDERTVEGADALDGLQVGLGGIGAEVLEGADVEPAFQGGAGDAVQALDLLRREAGERADAEELAGGGERGQALAGEGEAPAVSLTEQGADGHHLPGRPAGAQD